MPASAYSLNAGDTFGQVSYSAAAIKFTEEGGNQANFGVARPLPTLKGRFASPKQGSNGGRLGHLEPWGQWMFGQSPIKVKPQRVGIPSDNRCNIFP
jgi:hypothetical protein